MNVNIKNLTKYPINKNIGAGGQSGQTDEIELADDMCEDAEIECPTSNFR